MRLFSKENFISNSIVGWSWYQFLDSDYGYEDFDGKKSWVMIVNSHTLACVSQEEMFDALSKKEQLIYMFNLDKINALGIK